jgi:predicted nucleotidyltransferase
MKSKDEIISILKKYERGKAKDYGVEKIGIFGSVARDDYNKDSDIDIYVVGSLKGFFALSVIKSELEDILGCKVDIVRLRERMNPILKQTIEKEGIYV